jgi:P-type Cu+ transporter
MITDTPARPRSIRPAVSPASGSPGHRLLVSTLLALPVVVLSTVPGGQFRHWQWIALACAAPVVVWGAWPFHRAAARSARAGTATTDTLISLGTLAAFGWSVYSLLFGVAGEPGLTRTFPVVPAGGADPIGPEAAAGVVVLALAARVVEGWCRRRAGVALNEVHALVDDVVIGGRVAGRPPGAFVPMVILLAVATPGYWLGSGVGPASAIAAGVAVLLAAGPRAIGQATSTALLAGLSRAARLGILIRGPAVLESTRALDTVLLDRAGTVTTGVLTVHGVHPAGEVDADQALRLAGAVEQDSDHPIGRAITAAAAAVAGVDGLPGVAEFDSTPGLGVRGLTAELEGDTVIAHAVLVGRPALLAGLDIELPDDLVAARAAVEGAGHTAVAVAWDGVARAVIAVGDTVHPDSAAAVRGLRALGLNPVLLTGDDGTAARVLAAEVGIDADSVIAEVGADGKVDVVRRLQGEGRVVAVLGDEIDDADALAAADLGLAFGTGAAIGAGHLTVLRGDLLAAVDALRLSRTTLRMIRSNAGWAFAYHAVALPLAALGLLHPLLAGAAMALSSVFVMANGLRPLRFTASRSITNVT